MLTRIASLTGRVLRAAFRGILIFRRPRPIHARGRMLVGDIAWIGGAAASGIEWIDRPRDAPAAVVARLSRSVGLPPILPDVIGLALRVETDMGPADIELASSGMAILTRHVLFVHRSPSRARYGTLLPYRSSRGPVLICARQISRGTLPAGGATLDAALTLTAWRVRLYHATPTSRWQPFAEVTLRLASDQDDTDHRFDSVRHLLPGAATYPWVAALRQPSYDLVQRRPARSDAG